LAGSRALGYRRRACIVPLDPNASFESSHNKGIDRALRACIEAGVLELVQRWAASQ
jgi:hypothetical protein